MDFALPPEDEDFLVLCDHAEIPLHLLHLVDDNAPTPDLLLTPSLSENDEDDLEIEEDDCTCLAFLKRQSNTLPIVSLRDTLMIPFLKHVQIEYISKMHLTAEFFVLEMMPSICMCKFLDRLEKYCKNHFSCVTIFICTLILINRVRSEKRLILNIYNHVIIFGIMFAITVKKMVHEPPSNADFARLCGISALNFTMFEKQMSNIMEFYFEVTPRNLYAYLTEVGIDHGDFKDYLMSIDIDQADFAKYLNGC